MNTLIRFTLATLLALLATSFAHAGDKITYYHNDALGSPVAATNQQGQVIWRETYKPHGQRTTNATASADNKVWFTGKQEESALGINYFGARWYHPEVGRFLVIDPVGVSPENIHSFNRYGYANNNPYGYVDPDGRAPRERNMGRVEGVLSGGGSSLGARASRGGPATISGPGGGGSRIRGGSGEGYNVDPIPVPASGKTYQTYTKTNPETGAIYTGRTSGTRSPSENVANRDAGHHMNEKGFGPAELDRSSLNPMAIRGREQIMIEGSGSAKSVGGTSGNAINGIAPRNPRGNSYREAAKKEFGD